MCIRTSMKFNKILLYCWIFYWYIYHYIFILYCWIVGLFLYVVHIYYSMHQRLAWKPIAHLQLYLKALIEVSDIRPAGWGQFDVIWRSNCFCCTYCNCRLISNPIYYKSLTFSTSHCFCSGVTNSGSVAAQISCKIIIYFLFKLQNIFNSWLP